MEEVGEGVWAVGSLSTVIAGLDLATHDELQQSRLVLLVRVARHRGCAGPARA